MAAKHKHRSQLRAFLAKIYERPEAARRVADDAGLLTERISFSGSTQDIWHSLLSEAEKCNKLHDIVGIAIQEYPSYSEQLIALHRNITCVEAQTKVSWKPCFEKTTHWILSFYPRNVDQTIREEIALVMYDEIRDAYQEGGFSRFIHRVSISFGSLAIDITRERITQSPSHEPDKPIRC